MIAYKVVYDRLGDGSFLTSCSTEGELEQVYEPNVMAEAKVGGFLLFEQLQDAHDFLKKEYHGLHVNLFPIWGCYAGGQVTLPARRLSLGSLKLIERLWTSGLPADAYTLPWPPGTIAYKRVMLLEKVT